MKSNLYNRKLTFATLAAAHLIFLARPAFSQDRDEFERRERFRQDRGEFALGICVGQTLAAQGITLPMPGSTTTPTEPSPTTEPSTAPTDTSTDPTPAPSTETNQQAIRAAVETCRAQFEGQPTTASPTPIPSPSESGTN